MTFWSVQYHQWTEESTTLTTTQLNAQSGPLRYLCSLSIHLEPYYLPLRPIPFFFSLFKAAGRDSPVLDHAEIEVRQAFGTECLQQSNDFAVFILFVSFCNLGEGGKNSALVCITQRTMTAPEKLNLEKMEWVAQSLAET